jgi:hypothetical protein
VRDRKYEDHPIVKLVTEPDEFLARLARGASRLLEAATPWLVLAGVVLLLLAAAIVARRVWRSGRWADGARRIKILAPPEVAASGALTLWMGLHATLRPAWRRVLFGQPHLAWEVVADSDELAISLWVPNVIPPGLVERAVESAWPGARTGPELERPLFPEPGSIAITELALAEPEWFPIGEAPDTEPLRLALGTMTTLEPGERAVIQVLARPAISSARYRMLRAARKLRQVPNAATPFWAAGSSQGKPTRVARPSMDPTIDPDIRAILAKASSPLWHTKVRVAVSSHDRAIARGRIHALAGAFAVFEGRNGFRRRRMRGGLRRFEARSFPSSYLLSVPELAQVAALPSEPVPGLDHARARTLAPPRALPREGRILGKADGPGQSRPVAISIDDARHHMHVVGETGTGKSTLIASMVLADAEAGRSAIVIDPKGDLIEAILKRLPDQAMERTCLLDPDDPTQAVGLNVLAGDNPDLVVDHVVGVFKRIYEPWWGPRTDDIMRAACLTLVQIPGATLTEIPLLLSHDKWRKEVGERFEDDPGLGSFWMWFERLGDQQRANMIAPLLNKLRAFLLRGPVRAIVGQAEPKLDIDQLINGGGLLLVRIPKGTLGEETSRLLGAFAVARVWQAAMKRASLPESDRVDTTLYVDEMHNYLALPRSFEDLLAEARGYRLSLVLAHQHMNQVPRDMREALAANARTKLVFACSPEDAGHLEKHFEPHLTSHDLQNLAAFQSACRPCLDAGHGAAFTFRTEPLEVPKRKGRAAEVRRESGARFGVARSDVEAEIVDRHMDAETDLLPPTAEDREASDARGRSDSQSESQSGSQSGGHLDRLPHEAGKGQVVGAAGGGGE